MMLKICRCKFQVRMDVLMKIATVLDCKVEDLFETFNDEVDENIKQ